MKGAILIVPACERGRGGGHLHRSVFIFRKLKEMRREVFFYIPVGLKDDVFERFGELLSGITVISSQEEINDLSLDFVIIDRFKTSSKEFAFWYSLSQNIPLIGLDEGGPSRNGFDFLIDLLPAISKVRPNLSAPSLLPLPKNRRLNDSKAKAGVIRVLISFGAEDSAGLGFSAAQAFARKNKSAHDNPKMDITLIAPNLKNINEEELPGVNITGKLADLKEHLAEYDLFITHFGLGAFEAVYAGTAVLLVSPTRYHKKLADNAGFYSLTRAGLAAQNINYKFIKARTKEIARRFGFDKDQKENIASFIGEINPILIRTCPLCNCNENNGGILNKYRIKEKANVIARFGEETYRRCNNCGLIYLSRLKPPIIEYEKDYFFDLYKKQYGKTYLEDFPNLKKVGHRRLMHIGDILDSSHDGQMPSILDIGCAYGPFLAAANEGGFSCFGIDPAEDAVRYVKEELGFNALQGFFPDVLAMDNFRNVNGFSGQFDVITLWYVIEHFTEPCNVLKEIKQLLKKGGVLAFSTPSFSGISGRKNLKLFLKNSPPDHFTIWNPRSCRRILKNYGFSISKMVVKGHHPERFPVFGHLVNPGRKGFLFSVLLLISRLFRLGDTFEVYAKK